MIEFKEINKVYAVNNEAVSALRDINLKIYPGEIFGIIGESGAGKSTLLRIVNLLEKPTDGQILVEGILLTSLSRSELKTKRRNIGMIFQHFNLLESRTAYGNIALPLELLGHGKKEIDQRVKSLLGLTGLEAYANHYPDQLSGGQKQRVAIARALATKPHFLLCDEPTSALDPKSTSSILNLLKEINQRLNVTILIITHEMEVIKRICHRAAVLQKGEVVEYGPIVELFAQPKLDITKQLVQKALHLELPNNIKKLLQLQCDEKDESQLVRFTFVGDDSSKPLIATLVKKFDLTINIIQANIEYIQDVIVGFTVCQVSGKGASILLALDYVNASSVKAEVLGHV
jgi:D-methionine transport system ATP-binding protein